MPPLNLLGDFGGGGMLLALGVVAALLEAGRSGRGQVVDAAMVDGPPCSPPSSTSCRRPGCGATRRGANPLDGAAPFTPSTRPPTAATWPGALEPQFWAELLDRVGRRGPARPARL